MHSFVPCFAEKSLFQKDTVEQTGLWLVFFVEYWLCSLLVALLPAPKTFREWIKTRTNPAVI
jgi:hypothetical protein